MQNEVKKSLVIEFRRSKRDFSVCVCGRRVEGGEGRGEGSGRSRGRDYSTYNQETKAHRTQFEG